MGHQWAVAHRLGDVAVKKITICEIYETARLKNSHL